MANFTGYGVVLTRYTSVDSVLFYTLLIAICFVVNHVEPLDRYESNTFSADFTNWLGDLSSTVRATTHYHLGMSASFNRYLTDTLTNTFG